MLGGIYFFCLEKPCYQNTADYILLSEGTEESRIQHTVRGLTAPIVQRYCSESLDPTVSI
jgi:hypothetical protein